MRRLDMKRLKLLSHCCYETGESTSLLHEHWKKQKVDRAHSNARCSQNRDAPFKAKKLK